MSVRDVIAAMALDVGDERRLARSFYRAKAAEYRATLLDLSERTGHPRSRVVLSPEIRGALEAEAADHARRVVSTMNGYLVGQADRLDRAGLDDRQIALGLRDYMKERGRARADMIARIETSTARLDAQVSFFRENGLEPFFEFRGPPAKCEVCKALKTGSPWPMEKVLAVGYPHLNCTHTWHARLPANSTLERGGLRPGQISAGRGGVAGIVGGDPLVNRAGGTAPATAIIEALSTRPYYGDDPDERDRLGRFKHRISGKEVQGIRELGRGFIEVEYAGGRRVKVDEADLRPISAPAKRPKPKRAAAKPQRVAAAWDRAGRDRYAADRASPLAQENYTPELSDYSTPQGSAIQAFDGPDTYDLIQGATRDPDHLVEQINERAGGEGGLPALFDADGGEVETSTMDPEELAAELVRLREWLVDAIREHGAPAPATTRITGMGHLPAGVQERLDAGETVELVEPGFLAAAEDIQTADMVSATTARGPRAIWNIDANGSRALRPEGATIGGDVDEWIWPPGTRFSIRKVGDGAEQGYDAGAYEVVIL